MPELDFSNYAQEREELGITLITGERIVLPKILDTYALMELMGDLSPGEVNKLDPGEKNQFGLKLLKAILGEENVKKVINGIPREKTQEFGQVVLRYYGLAASEADGQDESEAEGKALALAKLEQPSPTSRSTTTSDTSMQTSSGSSPTPGESSTEDDSTGESSLAGLAPSPLNRSS